MKKINLFFLFSICSFLLYAQRTRPSLDKLRDILLNGNNNPGYVMLAVHRACWLDGCPENSTEAVQAALANSEVDIIEVDIKISSDNVLYLMHDNYLQRTTNFLDLYPGVYGTGTDDFGKYNKYPWSELSGLRLKNPDNVYTNSTIPLLADIINMVRDKNVILQLDIHDGIAFNRAFDLVQDMNAFKFVMFKGLFTLENFLPFFEDLTEEEKKQIIFAPFIDSGSKPRVNNPNVTGPTGFYLEWAAWNNTHPQYKGVGRLFEMLTWSAKDTNLLYTAARIRAEGRRMGIFSAQPEYYKGRFFGNTNIGQCCYDNAMNDRRGDWDFVLRPATIPGAGINGYIITDEITTFLQFFPNRTVE